MTTFAEKPRTEVFGALTDAHGGVRIGMDRRGINVALLSSVNESTLIVNALREFSVFPERVNLRTYAGKKRSETLLGLGYPVVCILEIPNDAIAPGITDFFTSAKQRDISAPIYLGQKSRSETLLAHLSGASRVAEFDGSSGPGWQAFAQHLHDPGRYPANTLLEHLQQQSPQGEQ